jgi:hypothetical protein
MIADLTIHYDAQAMGWNSRFAEVVRVNIMEITDTEAPVAVEWQYGKTRWFDGNHYKFIARVFDGEQDPNLRSSALSRYINGDGSRSYSYTRPYADTRILSSDRKFSPRRYPAVEDSVHRLNALEKAVAFSNDCILVGDDLLMRCGEPRLIYRPASRLLSAAIEIDVTEWTTDPNRFGRDVRQPTLITAAYSARLDAADQILAIASGWALVPDAPIFVLHIPDSIIREDYSEMLKEAAIGVVADSKNGGFSWIEALEEMNLLKDHVGREEFDLDYLSELLSGLGSKLSADERNRKHYIATVLRRWEDRPIGTDLAFDGPKPSGM